MSTDPYEFDNFKDEPPSKDTRIDELGFPSRVVNALRRERVRTLEDLLKWSASDLYAVRNISHRSVEAVISRLAMWDMKLPGTPKPARIVTVVPNIPVAGVEPLLTPEMVCTWLQINRELLYDLVQQRKIPYLRVGGRQLRFVKSELEQYLAENHKQAEVEL